MSYHQGTDDSTVVPQFTLSFDFEIAWGDVTNERWKQRESRGTYENLRRVLPAMLEEMRAMEFPATWATVGAMVEQPDKIKLDHLPTKAKAVVRSSLDSGRKSSFDGRDLFDMLLSHDSTKHQVACHSYSHVPFDYQEMSVDAVTTDLELAIAAYKSFGIETDVFVFPENTERFKQELLATGFKKIRTKAAVDMSNRLRYLVGTLISPPPFVIESLSNEGLIEETGSMLFNMGVGKPYRMPFVQKRAVSGLRALVKTKSDRLHIWAHPFNFAESDYLYNTFIRYLRKVANERDKGKLTIVTM